MKLENILLLFLHWATLSSAHFQLYTPVAIGASSPANQAEGTGPCGGFAIDNRDNVTTWPTGGYPVYMITTHPQVVLAFRAALLNDTSTWINVIPPINQQGLGHFCDPVIPGFAPWVGLPVVLQVAQFAPDGINYQCAAITYVAGPATPPASNACENSTGVSASVAVGFTQTVPFGTVITPTNTALPSGVVNTNATMTGSSASKTSSTAASTSKTVSGAVNRFNHQGGTGRWEIWTVILGFGALAL